MQASKTFVMVDRPFWKDKDPVTGRDIMSMTLTDRLTRGTYLFDNGPDKPGVIIFKSCMFDPQFVKAFQQRAFALTVFLRINFAPFAAHGQVLFVSVDYERDRGEALRRYVEYFNPAFRAASAPPAALHLLLRQLDMQAVKTSSDDSPDYAFEHSSEIVLVGPDLRVLALFDFPHEPADIAARVRAIVQFASQPR